MNKHQETKENMTRKHIDTRLVIKYFCIIYLVLSFFTDVLIHTIPLPYWHISSDYLGLLFSALCTVAVLGNAVLSIILSAFSNKILGFTVKEILQMSACEINIPKSTKISFIAIIFAIPLLAAEYLTTITALTIYIVALISITSVSIWKLLADEKYVRNMIEREIESHGVSDPERFFMRWFPELEESFQSNNESMQDLYISLLSKVVQTGKNAKSVSSSTIEKRISDSFNIASFRLGFVDAYKKVIYFNDWKIDPILHSDKIALSLINRIKFCSVNEIDTYRIPETIDDIIERMEVSENKKIRYCYGYFKSVKANEVMPNRTRESILNSIIEKLSYLRDASDGTLRSKILLYIAKYCVLENEDITNSQAIFLMIINNLYNENRYSHQKCYVATISQLFRAIFFYSYYENETLKEDYRSNLQLLFALFSPSKNRVSVSLNGLLAENHDDIVNWLTEDAALENQELNMFDYFEGSVSSKTATWTKENLLGFAFFYYAIVGYSFSLFPAKAKIESDELDLNEKEKVCSVITSLFDSSSELLDSVKSKIKVLQSLLNEQECLPDYWFTENFTYYNQKLSEIKTSINMSCIANASFDLNQLNETLEKLFIDMQPFVYDNTLPLNEEKRLKIRPNFTHVYENYIRIAAKNNLYIIKEVLNNFVKATIPPVTLDFGTAGVMSLKSKLTESKYKYRNYTYVDDWAIKKEVRDTTHFSELVELLNSIPFASRGELNHPTFLKTSSIMFNAKVVSYSLNSPTAEECEEYIQNFKIADGKYRIDGTVQNFKQSIDFVQSNYRIETAELCIATDITPESGFRIEFQRNK